MALDDDDCEVHALLLGEALARLALGHGEGDAVDLLLPLGEGESEPVAQTEAQEVPEAVPAACAPPVAVTETDLEKDRVTVPLLLGLSSTEGLASQGE